MLNDVQNDLGDLVERLDHVALAVERLESPVRLMQAIGAQFMTGGDEVAAGFRWVQFSVPGGGTIELITPLDVTDADHFLVRFLAASGEGMHHVTLKVSDLKAAVAIMTESGYTVVGLNDTNPSWREAFVHPKSTHGLLIQLAQWDDSDKLGATTLEDVLAGYPTGPDQ